MAPIQTYVPMAKTKASRKEKAAKPAPEPKEKKVARKQNPEDSEPPAKRSKKDTAVAPEPGPTPDPDFEISWANFDKVKAHFKLNDAQTQSTLVAILGPDTRTAEFWKSFKVPKSPAASAPVEPVPSTVPPCVPSKSVDTTDAPPRDVPPGPDPFDTLMDLDDEVDDDELDEEETESPDQKHDDDDGDELASTCGHSGKPDSPTPPGSTVVTGCGSPVDQLETQPTEHVEPVLTPIPKDDPAEDARKKLEDELKKQATPTRNTPQASLSQDKTQTIKSENNLMLKM